MIERNNPGDGSLACVKGGWPWVIGIEWSQATYKYNNNILNVMLLFIK